MFHANGLTVPVMTNRPGRLDNVLAVRFGEPLGRYDSDGDKKKDHFYLGGAFDVGPSDNPGEADRWNRRLDGEVGIFLDEQLGQGPPGDLPVKWYGPDFVASVTFHEIGHAFGLKHLPDARGRVMDDSYEEHVTPSLTRNAEPIADNPKGVTHSPYYHWMLYAEGMDPLPPTSAGVLGTWDLNTAPSRRAKVRSAGSDETTMEERFISTCTLEVEPAAVYDLLLVPFSEGSRRFSCDALSPLGDAYSGTAVRFEPDPLQPSYLVGRSEPDGPYDVVFAFVDAGEANVEWIEGAMSGKPGWVLKRAADTGLLDAVGSFTARVEPVKYFVPPPAYIAEPVVLAQSGDASQIDRDAGLRFAGEGVTACTKVRISGEALLDSVSLWMESMSGTFRLSLLSDFDGEAGIELFAKSFDAADFSSLPGWVHFGDLNWGVPAGEYWLGAGVVGPDAEATFGVEAVEPSTINLIWDGLWIGPLGDGTIPMKVSGVLTRSLPAEAILRLTFANGALRLRWPVDSPLILERAGTLSEPAWEAYGGMVETEDDEHVVVVEPADAMSFFRLAGRGDTR
ncbi:MAG: hypothetical protein H7A47_11040 [Verrucomicrobiales bacterium]|nr:hypothetical protein [Verrucomicrobiales bacterium]